MRFSLAVLFPAILAIPAVAQPPERNTPVDRAIDRGLAHLQALQNRIDGSWRAMGNQESPAVTSLAVMAFLAAGHVPGEGKYGESVEKGIRWVLRKQQPNGLIANNGGTEMYHHGISTLMLAEAAGMTDGELGKELRRKLEKAIVIILKAQRKTGADRGGWRYHVAPVDGADISVTGWQLMALRAAKNLGCDVPAESIDRAIAYIKGLQDARTGGFNYTRSGGLRVSCTGTSILALELCGKEQHRCPEALRGGAYLIQDHNLPHWGQEWFFYSVYYGSQAAFQLGGNYWAVYKPRLHEVLLHNQQADGGWMGRSRDSHAGGESYSTAMAILCLAVEYRFLPIYQRGDEPSEREK